MPAQKPSVLVFEEFATVSTTPVAATLPTLIVGPAYQVLDYPEDKTAIKSTSSYGTLNLPATGSTVAPVGGATAVTVASPPGLHVGALLDTASVEIHLSGTRVEIAHASDGVTAADSSEVTSATSNFTTSGVVAGDTLIATIGVIGTPAVAATLTLSTVTYTAQTAGVAGNSLTVTHVAAVGISQATEVGLTGETGLIVTLGTDGAGVVNAVVSDVVSAVAADPAVAALFLASGTPSALVAVAGEAPLTLGADAIYVPGTTTVTRTVRTAGTTTLTVTDEFTASGYMFLRVERLVADSVVAASKITITSPSIAIEGGIAIGGKPVSFSDVYVAYRALRTDLSSVQTLNSTTDITALFGRTLDSGVVNNGIDARNPLAVGAYVALQNSSNTPIDIYAVSSDDDAGYLSALDGISTRDDYAVVVLTSSISTISAYGTAFENTSSADYSIANGVDQKFRVVIGSAGSLPSYGTIVELNTDGKTQQITGSASPTSVHTITVSATGAPDFQTLGVLPGFTIQLGTGAWLTVARVNSATQLEVEESIAPVAAPSSLAVSIKDAEGASIFTDTCTVAKVADAVLFLELLDSNATFVSSGVAAGQFIEFPANPNTSDFTGSQIFQIASVQSNQRVRIVDNGRDTSLVANELPHGMTRVVDGTGDLVTIPTTATLHYRIVKSLDRDGQASALAAVATSLGNKRVVICWPDSVTVTGLTDGGLARNSDGSYASAEPQPGYYLACAIGGLTSGQPSQQGFTRMSIAGIELIYNSNNYFTDRQLTTISNSGWLLFTQANSSTLPIVMHQLTTDVSTVEFREYSCVKNFDFAARSYKDVLDPFIGKWNLTADTINFVSAALEAEHRFLRENTKPRIGAPIISARTAQLAQSAISSDRLDCWVEVDFPKPLNTVALHLVSV